MRSVALLLVKQSQGLSSRLPPNSIKKKKKKGERTERQVQGESIGLFVYSTKLLKVTPLVQAGHRTNSVNSMI